MNPPLDLDELIRVRQSLLSQGTLRQVLEDMRTVDPSSESDPRFIFLETVQFYSNAVNAKEKDAAEWIRLLSEFSMIHTTTPELRFYVTNYQLLCARNAGPPNDAKVPELYKTAATIAWDLGQQERSEALGHLQYNVARWMHKQGRTGDALAHWQSASSHRFHFYGLLKMGKADHEELLAAAQQLAKMHRDFPMYFLDRNIDECGVAGDVIEELEADFGQELYAFSAKP